MNGKGRVDFLFLFCYTIFKKSNNTKVYKMANKGKIFAIGVRRDDSRSGECIYEKVAYLPELALYLNCSDINELSPLQEHKY